MNSAYFVGIMKIFVKGQYNIICRIKVVKKITLNIIGPRRNFVSRSSPSLALSSYDK